MSFSEKKYREKLRRQELTNPGRKEPYIRKWIGRPVQFKDRTKYNRQKAKQTLRQELKDL